MHAAKPTIQHQPSMHKFFSATPTNFIFFSLFVSLSLPSSIRIRLGRRSAINNTRIQADCRARPNPLFYDTEPSFTINHISKSKLTQLSIYSSTAKPIISYIWSDVNSYSVFDIFKKIGQIEYAWLGTMSNLLLTTSTLKLLNSTLSLSVLFKIFSISSALAFIFFATSSQ